MPRTSICAALFIAWSVALIHSQQITGGPDNVVVVSSGSVALFCNRSVSAEIQWTFRPTGSDREQNIPGQYRQMITNYGVHSLVLEDVQLSSAGTYVCRPVGSAELKPAGAFLVVIAQKPCCHVDDADSVQPTVTCSVTYAGQMDAELSLLMEGNSTIVSQNFTAQSATSSDAISTFVAAGTPQQTLYSCRVSFFSTHSHMDVAKNHPGFVEASCYLPFQRAPVYTVDSSDLYAQTTNALPGESLQDAASDGTAGKSVAIYICLVLIVIQVVVIGVMALCLARRRLLSCPCWQSTLRRHPAICCYGDIAAGHVTDHSEADKRHSHAQVSQDDATVDTEPTSSTENTQLIDVDDSQHNNGQIITVDHISTAV